MSRILDVSSSTLASQARLWRGTAAFRPARRQPEKLLELYEYEACPYCRRRSGCGPPFCSGSARRVIECGEHSGRSRTKGDPLATFRESRGRRGPTWDRRRKNDERKGGQLT